MAGPTRGGVHSANLGDVTVGRVRHVMCTARSRVLTRQSWCPGGRPRCRVAMFSGRFGSVYPQLGRPERSGLSVGPLFPAIDLPRSFLFLLNTAVCTLSVGRQTEEMDKSQIT